LIRLIPASVPFIHVRLQIGAVVGAAVVGGLVVGATVVGGLVVGAAVVGGLVVGAHGFPKTLQRSLPSVDLQIPRLQV